MHKNSFLLLVWADAFDVGRMAKLLKQEKFLHVEVIYSNIIPGRIMGGMYVASKLQWQLIHTQPDNTEFLITSSKFLVPR